MPTTKQIRIGFDARWYNDSGVGSYVSGLLNALAGSSSGVDLVVYEDPNNPVPGLEASACERIPVRSGKYSLASQMELRRRCKRDGLDLFHSPFYMMPLFSSCPVVVTVHDLIPFLFPIYTQPKRSLVRRGYRAAVARAAQCIAVSANTAGDLQRILGVAADRIAVVHNAVVENIFHLRREASDLGHLAAKFGIHSPYVVVSSARNWLTKNLPAGLKALELAREKGNEFQTVVYGPEEGLRAACLQNGPPKLPLVSTGHLPAAELAIIFRNAHAFVMPSLYEGFGLPVLEAMSCGCAVITSTGGSLPEVVGNGAQVFAPMDVNGMAQAIRSLLQNPDELSQWRERARKRAADFSWSKAAEQTVSVYHLARRCGARVAQK